MTAKGVHAQDKDAVSVVVVDNGFVVGVAPELFGALLDTRFGGRIWRPQGKQEGSNGKATIMTKGEMRGYPRVLFEPAPLVGSTSGRAGSTHPRHTRVSTGEARKRERSQTCRRPPIRPSESGECS